MAANIETTPAADLADGWIRLGYGHWMNSNGWSIRCTPGYRAPAHFSIARPDGVVLADGESTITAAKTCVAIQEAIALGLL